MSQPWNRRQILRSLGTLAAMSSLPGDGRYSLQNSGNPESRPATPRAHVERMGIGAIGMRYQGTVITHKAANHGDVVAICDVDRHVREQARASFGSTPRIFEDYRDLLARDDVDIVMIGTPDHWHAKMVVDACHAGKDVYVEKPLTLTIDEGKAIVQAVNQTGRTVQVGSWQRSDRRFRLAVEMVRGGRIGQLQQVEVTLAQNPSGGPFPTRSTPNHLNWDLWLGQTPLVPYIEQRCHYTFRWWLEYSGGMLTDWGAHHIDIADWAINAAVKRISGKGVYPSIENGYNVPTEFEVTYEYDNGVRLIVRDRGRNGILLTGSEGRIFVNRGTLDGAPVDRLADDPLPAEGYHLYAHDHPDRPQRAGKLDAIINHMANFFDCVGTTHQPISDVASQHRTATICHLGNIAMRTGQTIEWDPEAQQIVDDPQANQWLSREQRPGYEV